ncbi:uncharacterized protein LOC143204507 [Rhynchophorus ferrugineus]|uniref:uncharacterized protein LOC143204507 n=1 Tax=Rhynchophorus ferrugineus TaxID=354439 RepID=UPI003FCD053F
MIFKAAFLICVSLSLVISSEQSALDDLQTTMDLIEMKISVATTEAAATLRTLNTPLKYYAAEAENRLIQELNEVAKPYWTFIEEAQQEAEQNGQNIDNCVDVGNSELYINNNTFVGGAYDEISVMVIKGERKIEESYGPAKNQPLKQLEDMKERVKACTDEDYAVELKKQLNEEYVEMSTGIANAIQEAEDFAFVEFAESLEGYTFNHVDYIISMNSVISNVKYCIETSKKINPKILI